MNAAVAAGALVVVGIAAQIFVPGNTLFHTGWYNVGLISLAILTVVGTRRQPLIAFGVAAIAFAGVASGLLGPDVRTVIGAPGASLRVDEAGGTLLFPLVQADVSPVILERGSSAQPIGAWRFTATALLRRVPRSVVAVEAFDRRGAHLTITQPTGSAFLSPVLLMENTQNIDGLNLPYDSFAVPAAHRIVKAVLFSAAQAASMPALASAHGPVVLFDLENDTGVSIPHGIGIARDGDSIVLGGLRLHPSVLSYPAIEVFSIPDLAVVAAGALAILVGLLLTRRARQGKIAER
ncbi:MAG: hypothetical protein WBD74_04985 [Candidatus Aquilonibacter sp.]